MTFKKSRLLALAAAGLMLTCGTASAETKLRVGKAQPNQFAFVPADIGVEAGIFKKHGLNVEISSFGGDAKMMQALAADGIDVALGGGPAFATIVKGTPMKAALAAEILEAYQGQGNAIRKRDEVHKMAQANKAFAHFRW